jgi:hypothetical protein
VHFDRAKHNRRAHHLSQAAIAKARDVERAQPFIAWGTVIKTVKRFLFRMLRHKRSQLSFGKITDDPNAAEPRATAKGYCARWLFRF